MVGIPGKSFSVAELEAAGVRRISFAASFYRAALRAARSAAKEALEAGTFTYLTKE
jgi:2-methylisocitrate lyase-like PEP mutase family enzyme